LGALVAYQAAWRVQAEGRPVRALIASGRCSLVQPSPQPWRHRLADGALIAELRSLGGTDAEVVAHPELLDLCNR